MPGPSGLPTGFVETIDKNPWFVATATAAAVRLLSVDSRREENLDSRIARVGATALSLYLVAKGRPKSAALLAILGNMSWDGVLESTQPWANKLAFVAGLFILGMSDPRR